MRIGSIAIANDLLGFVISEDLSDKTYTLRDEEGVERKILREECHEVSNPNALAFLMYNKVYKKAGGK